MKDKKIELLICLKRIREVAYNDLSINNLKSLEMLVKRAIALSHNILNDDLIKN